MNACSAACGFCGRCTDDVLDYPPEREYLFCDECGKDAVHPISLAGVGVFCSRPCADAGSRRHEQVMSRRRA